MNLIEFRNSPKMLPKISKKIQRNSAGCGSSLGGVMGVPDEIKIKDRRASCNKQKGESGTELAAYGFSRGGQQYVTSPVMGKNSRGAKFPSVIDEYARKNRYFIAHKHNSSTYREVRLNTHYSIHTKNM